MIILALVLVAGCKDHGVCYEFPERPCPADFATVEFVTDDTLTGTASVTGDQVIIRYTNADGHDVAVTYAVIGPTSVITPEMQGEDAASAN